MKFRLVLMNKLERERNPICPFSKIIGNRLFLEHFFAKGTPGYLYIMQFSVWMIELEQREEKVLEEKLLVWVVFPKNWLS